VRFAPLSSEISAKARKRLDRLARNAGAKATATIVIGFVQGTRQQGVKGRFTVRGDRVAPEVGARARKVTVTVTFTK